MGTNFTNCVELHELAIRIKLLPVDIQAKGYQN